MRESHQKSLLITIRHYCDLKFSLKTVLSSGKLRGRPSLGDHLTFRIIWFRGGGGKATNTDEHFRPIRLCAVDPIFRTIHIVKRGRDIDTPRMCPGFLRNLQEMH